MPGESQPPNLSIDSIKGPLIGTMEKVAKDANIEILRASTFQFDPVHILSGEGVFTVNTQTKGFETLNLQDLANGANIGFIFFDVKGNSIGRGQKVVIITAEGTEVQIPSGFYIVRAYSPSGKSGKAQLLNMAHGVVAEIPMEIGKAGSLANPVELRFDDRKDPSQLCYAYSNNNFTSSFCLVIKYQPTGAR